jgi:hypothetical protein
VPTSSDRLPVLPSSEVFTGQTLVRAPRAVGIAGAVRVFSYATAGLLKPARTATTSSTCSWLTNMAWAFQTLSSGARVHQSVKSLLTHCVKLRDLLTYAPHYLP